MKKSAPEGALFVERHFDCRVGWICRAIRDGALRYVKVVAIRRAPPPRTSLRFVKHRPRGHRFARPLQSAERRPRGHRCARPLRSAERRLRGHRCACPLRSVERRPRGHRCARPLRSAEHRPCGHRCARPLRSAEHRLRGHRFARTLYAFILSDFPAFRFLPFFFFIRNIAALVPARGSLPRTPGKRLRLLHLFCCRVFGGGIRRLL